MRRIFGAIAIALALALPVIGGLSLAGGLYVRGEVKDELVSQKVFFAPKGTEGLPADIQQYGGTQVTNGAQAAVFANQYLKVHIQSAIDETSKANPAVKGATTYAEVSTASRTHPGNQALGDLVQTVFRGEMLRASLLSSWGWWTFATILIWVAIGSFIGAALAGIAAVLLLTPLAARIRRGLHIGHRGEPHPA
jgi:hypothetical protein